MQDRTRLQYSRALGLDLASLDLIKENKYCLIYRANAPAGPVIVKKYKGSDPGLVRVEADALRAYHLRAKAGSGLIDSGEPLLDEGENLLCVGFIDGDCFSDVLYRACADRSLRAASLRAMTVLGTFVRETFETTQRPGEETSPFIFEYFGHCSARLQQMAVLGWTFFRGLESEAGELAGSFRRSGAVPCFVHGDFVFKNMLVKADRVGLIDFANTNSHSHCLNDIYNLRLALANMMLPGAFKRDLWTAFEEGLGPLSFPETVHRFYFEYHRRRWLLLKLSSGNPKDLLQGLRGLLTFARPFVPGGTTV